MDELKADPPVPVDEKEICRVVVWAIDDGGTDTVEYAEDWPSCATLDEIKEDIDDTVSGITPSSPEDWSLYLWYQGSEDLDGG